MTALATGINNISPNSKGVCEMDKPEKPVIKVKPHIYQPSKAELNELVKIDTTPDALARAVLRPVKIVEDLDA